MESDWSGFSFRPHFDEGNFASDRTTHLLLPFKIICLCSIQRSVTVRKGSIIRTTTNRCSRDEKLIIDLEPCVCHLVGAKKREEKNQFSFFCTFLFSQLRFVCVLVMDFFFTIGTRQRLPAREFGLYDFHFRNATLWIIVRLCGRIPIVRFFFNFPLFTIFCLEHAQQPCLNFFSVLFTAIGTETQTSSRCCKRNVDTNCENFGTNFFPNDSHVFLLAARRLCKGIHLEENCRSRKSIKISLATTFRSAQRSRQTTNYNLIG